jgi:nitrous oxide reductase accessory protein NosL
MDRAKFDFSRVLVSYEDGSTLGACSIHCAVVDMIANLEKTPSVIKAADFNTKQLIDADKAIWVIDAGRPGIMTKRAKWAFAKKDDAQAYINQHGGKLATFDEVVKATFDDMYADMKMIRDKRKDRAKKSPDHNHQH